MNTEVKYIKTVSVYRPKNSSIMSMSTRTNLEEDFINNADNYDLVNVYNYEITEEEFNTMDNNEIFIPYTENPDIYETNGKKLTTSISYLSSNKRYRLKNELVWKTVPKVRSVDLFGIAGASATQIPVAGSEYARGVWTEHDSCKGTSFSVMKNYTNTGKWTYNSEGYGIGFQIPEDYTETITWDVLYGDTPYPCVDYVSTMPKRGTVSKPHSMSDMVFTMYYDVAKQNYGNTVNAYGSYQHAVVTISLDAGFTFSVTQSGSLGGVFSLNATLQKKYDGMGGTRAQVLNPQW